MVVIWRVPVVPVAFNKLHAAPLGRPLQVTEKLELMKFENVSEVLALPPGALTVSVAGFALTDGAGAGATTIEVVRVEVAGELSESATLITKLKVPLCVGKPVIAPELAPNDNPGGKLLPGAILQL